MFALTHNDKSAAADPAHACTGLSVVLVIMYGLRPFLVSGQKHKHMPSPLLGPQKIVGVITIAAGWASLFLGCVVVHQNWVRLCCFVALWLLWMFLVPAL